MSPLNKAGNDLSAHDIMKALSEANSTDFVRNIHSRIPSVAVGIEYDGLGNRWIILDCCRTNALPIRLQILMLNGEFSIYAMASSRHVPLARRRTQESALEFIESYLKATDRPGASPS